MSPQQGPVATVLVKEGELSKGDIVLAGDTYGRVKMMRNSYGKKIKSATSSMPVEILGLDSVPQAGDRFFYLDDINKAKAAAEEERLRSREKSLAERTQVTMDNLFSQIEAGNVKELNLIVRADVQGSVEALSDQLGKIPQEKIKLRIIRSGAGAITEGDVLLASASNAVVIGFNVRPERKAAETAARDNVDIHLYTVIYDAVEEMRKALEGLLEPTTREVRLGSAEVRETFKISKVGTIAGCMVSDGKVARSADVRLLRDNVVVYTGKVASLKRFKDDASEVKQGYECGIGIAGYNDVKEGDLIEFFVVEQIAAETL